MKNTMLKLKASNIHCHLVCLNHTDIKCVSSNLYSQQMCQSTEFSVMQSLNVSVIQLTS